MQKCHDGSTRVLTDVWYRSKTVTIRDGVFKIVSGALVVIIGIMNNNPYYL